MKREQLSCNAINRIAEASPLGYFAPPRLSEGRCRAPSLIKASLGVCWSIAIGSSLIREMNSFVRAGVTRARRFKTAALLVARQMRSGVAGPAKLVTPSGANASRMAFVTAGKAPTAPASPQPLTPSGLVLQRVPLKPRSKDGKSSARGSA